MPLRDLVRHALRMRPDRLVVGEVRGAEVCDLLAALNTGTTAAGTVHANSAREVARLEALAATGGLSRPALHSQRLPRSRSSCTCSVRCGTRVLDVVGVPVRAGRGGRGVPGLDAHRWVGRRAAALGAALAEGRCRCRGVRDVVDAVRGRSSRLGRSVVSARSEVSVGC